MPLPAVNLDACLPPALRAPDTTIVRIRAGLSGAGVYRVQAAGQAFVLKVSAPTAPPAEFQRTLGQLRLVADAGLAPAIVHVDEEQRAILTTFIVDRSFPALYFDAQTRPAALGLLGRALRRVHDLPAPQTRSRSPEEFLDELWSGLAAASLPAFVREAVGRVRDEPAPACERALVLSHNDVNPTNLAFDGERLFLLDWDTSGQNDPFYDLATISVFLRMDAGDCRTLLAAHDDAPVAALPARFVYNQRLASALCAAMFLHLARQAGHAGASGGETFASAPSLSEFYQRARSGAVSIASPDGQWEFGLALAKASASFCPPM
jgi:aminoglycoside phosphotransferase (APT) family kinase protein